MRLIIGFKSKETREIVKGHLKAFHEIDATLNCSGALVVYGIKNFYYKDGLVVATLNSTEDFIITIEDVTEIEVA